jgi:hypothetical protein
MNENSTPSKTIKPFATAITIVFLAVIWLKAAGRGWLGPDNNLLIWYGEANGPGTSQHFLDPYSFTHFLHGLVFFWFIVLILKNLDFYWRFTLAVAFESIWEIVENSPTIIERYREATIALGYNGDSIINSLSDILMCSIGFYTAAKIGGKKSLLLFILVELLLLVWIRDNLTLNVIMLIYPVEAIKTWQGLI